MSSERKLDGKYYQVATAGSIAEKMATWARDNIYTDFLHWVQPNPGSSILDVGVSDVVGEAANVVERKYPYPTRITAAGLGTGNAFRDTFPKIDYRHIVAGEPLPFADGSFDIATSNAVLEHVGSLEAQVRLVAEMARVAHQVFISVPNRYFPIEHHTGIPILHWWDPTFRAACGALGKAEWADPTNLILMTISRLERLHPVVDRVHIGVTGLRLGRLSSNLFMYFSSSPR